MMKTGILSAAVSAIALTSAPASGQVAAAPVAAQAEETAPNQEDIVVTGSRIARPGLTSISPVATLGRDEIQLDRAVNIETVLTELPQFTGSFSGVSNGADSRGAATADLRGLGQNRTLVLIDGTRGTPFGFRNSVDLNSIPASLVERVEVLTGGAAAVYGADAVAGVVNFIMRDDFEGVEGTALYNVSERGDASNYGANVAVGTGLGDRGNVTAYVGWSERMPVFKSARGFASPERNDAGIITARPLGGSFRRSDSAPVFNLSGVGGSAASSTFAFTDAGVLQGPATTSVLSPLETLIIAQKRFNAATFFHYDLTSGMELYGRAMFVRSESRDSLPPATIATNVLIQRNNPFLDATLDRVLAGAFNLNSTGTGPGTDAALINVTRSLGEFGTRTTETVRTAGQGQIGVRGDLGRFKWNVYAQYGITDETSTVFGEGLLARLQQAANTTVDAGGGPVCTNAANGCVPVDLFGPGRISNAARDFIGTSLKLGRRREQFVTSATLAGDTSGFLTLPGGSIDFVVGVEYRDEQGDNEFDPAIRAGQTFNQGTRRPFSGEFNVKEVFGEVRLPILRDIPLVRELNLEAAYRYSDYSTTGGTDAYKIGGDWAVTDDIRFRGSYQSVVRSPNIGELFGATSSIPLLNITDPCANPAASGADVATCVASGAPAGGFTQNLTGALFLFGGDPNIQPETGKTWTAGAVLTPSFLKGFTLTADYYNIKIDNAIGAVLPQPTLNTCFIVVRDIDNIFCQRVRRGPNGQLASVDSSDINVAELRSKGVDVVADYNLNLGRARLGLDYAGSFVISQKQQNGVTAPVVECAGRFGATCGLEVRRALPKYRHRASATVKANDITLRGSWRLEGKVRDDAIATFLVEEIGAISYFDLALAVDVRPSMRFVIGVDNLLDRRPPIVGTNAADANTFPQSYDVIGRRFGVSVTLRN